MKKTGERIILESNTESEEDQISYLRSLAGYKFVLSKLDNLKEGSCLEVGCTDGFGTKMIATELNKVIAIDKDKEVIEHALSVNDKENIEFKCADAVNLPFEDDTFDVVVALHVVEHIKEEIKFLSEVRRVLKKEGWFFCSTPNRLIRDVKGKPWNRFHVKEYSYEELKEALKNQFKDVNVYSIQAQQSIYDFEMKRLKRIKLLRKIDFLNLRKIIPPELQSIILEKIKGCFNKKYAEKEQKQKHSIDEFQIKQENIKDCLDLIALAKK